METEKLVQLPSRFQPTEKVGLQMLIDFFENARDGIVTSVRFTQSKVRYDLQIPVRDAGDPLDAKPKEWFRLSNVDSDLVHPPYENGLYYNSTRDMNSREHDRIAKAINPADKIPFYSEKTMEDFADFVQSQFKRDDPRPINSEWLVNEFKKTLIG